MAEKAVVSSVDAIESFRSNLIIYLSKARPTLEEINAEVMRLRSWMDNDQRSLWESQFKRRSKELQEAQAALFSSRIGLLKKESAAEQMAVHKAKRSLDEAELKIRVLKRWSRDFEGTVQPLVKQMEKLHTVLSNDMPKAIVYLAQVVKTLSSYADRSAPASVNEPAASSAGAAAEKPAEGEGAS